MAIGVEVIVGVRVVRVRSKFVFDAVEFAIERRRTHPHHSWCWRDDGEPLVPDVGDDAVVRMHNVHLQDEH